MDKAIAIPLVRFDRFGGPAVPDGEETVLIAQIDRLETHRDFEKKPLCYVRMKDGRTLLTSQHRRYIEQRIREIVNG